MTHDLQRGFLLLPQHHAVLLPVILMQAAPLLKHAIGPGDDDKPVRKLLWRLECPMQTCMYAQKHTVVILHHVISPS